MTSKKIDKLISLLVGNPKEVLVLTNKETIDSFFEEIEKESIKSNYATFNTNNTTGVRGLSIKGFDFYFGELKDLENIKFKNK